ncbi:MAG: type II toxin-antitoxin system HipA family toxin [Verrucomicrobiales bacterium]
MELRVDFVPGGGLESSLVGRLYGDRGGVVWFEYDAAWRAKGIELSPVFLRLRDAQGVLSSPSRDFGPLFGLFQDALPDWWGERLMRRFFEHSGVPWRRVTSLQKLACQGRRKTGALTYTPEIEDSDLHADMAATVEELATSAEELLQGRTDGLLDRLVNAGLSPGGAQPKASLAFNESFTASMAVDPAPKGYDAWLVKFDLAPELSAGRLELAYHRMAAAAGITVPEIRLLESGKGAAHFLSRRFDRGADARRFHIHTFSGLTHTPVRDPMEYGDLLEIARVLVDGGAAVAEVYRRAVFNILAGNDDDHGRNHAFLMDEAGRWSLAPAYDLNPSTNPLSSGWRAGAIGGKAAGLRRDDLLRFADEHDVRDAEGILRAVEESVAAWPDHGRAAGVPETKIEDISRQQPGWGA